MANKTFAQRWRRLTAEEERASGGMTHAASLYAEDLTETTNNTEQTFNGPTTKKGSHVHMGGMYLVTPLKDDSDSAFNNCTAEIGRTGDPNQHGGQWQLNSNGSEILADVDHTAYVYVAAGTILIRINSMASKALNDIDTGEVVFMIAMHELAEVELAGNNA